MSSRISKHYTVPQPENYSYPERINLNEIIQEALQRLQRRRDLHFVLRCENLPVIEAARTHIIKVFEDIVQMIAGHFPKGAKLFLYVNCEEERKEKIDPQLTQGYKRYGIYFHTNIQTDEVWKNSYRNTIDECTAILGQYGASFTVNEIKSTGCLFSISLLGKM